MANPRSNQPLLSGALCSLASLSRESPTTPTTLKATVTTSGRLFFMVGSLDGREESDVRSRRRGIFEENGQRAGDAVECPAGFRAIDLKSASPGSSEGLLPEMSSAPDDRSGVRICPPLIYLG